MEGHGDHITLSTVVSNQQNELSQYEEIESLMLENPQNNTPGLLSEPAEEFREANAAVTARESFDHVTQLVRTTDPGKRASRAAQGNIVLNEAWPGAENGNPRRRRLKLNLDNHLASSQRGELARTPSLSPPSRPRTASHTPKKIKLNISNKLKRPALSGAKQHEEDLASDSHGSDTVKEPPSKRKCIITFKRNAETSIMAVRSSWAVSVIPPDTPYPESASTDTEMAVAVASPPDAPHTPSRSVSPVSSKTETGAKLPPPSTERPDETAREGATGSKASQLLTPSSSKEPDDTQPAVKKSASKAAKKSTAIRDGAAPDTEQQTTASTIAQTRDQKPDGQQSVPKPASQAIRRSTRQRTFTEKAKTAYGSVQAVVQATQSDAPGQDAGRKFQLTKEEKMKQQKQKKMDMYTPSLDPLTDPKVDTYTPNELARMDYVDMSSKYFEQQLGKNPFKNLGASAAKPLTTMRDLQVTDGLAEGQESFAEKERRWEEEVRQAQSRAKGLRSFAPAPKNMKQLKAWLGRHGDPLEKHGYVTEHLKKTEEVNEAQSNRVVHPGAMRFDTPRNRIQSLVKHLGGEESIDDDHQDGEQIQQTRSIQPHSLNDDKDNFNAHDADPVNETNHTTPNDDVSGVYAPSFRWHFNRRIEDENDVQAAMALMQLNSANLETSGCRATTRLAQHSQPHGSSASFDQL